MQLILASSSPYRKQLLRRLQLPFTCASPDIDESAQPGETPEQLALRLAESKARALAETYPTALIIGSDQVAVLDGQILGKPGSTDKAFQQLSRCSGQTVRFLTGLCLLNTSDQHASTLVEPFEVLFRRLSDQQIQGYIAKDQPLDCAGSFKWESLGISLFEKMTSNDVTSLEGLPLIQLTQLLAQQGIDVLSH